jgi:hypothetical protein
MEEQKLTQMNGSWQKRVEKLQTLLKEVKPLLVAAEAELSERLAAISAFEFRVRSHLEPLTRRMDKLDEEINSLRRQLRHLQDVWLFAEDFSAGELYDRWRSTEGEGAAASGAYRYHEAPVSPPPESLTADQSAALKQLYRQLARRFHPDFALDEADRAYRTGIMMAINAAYAVGDLEKLEQLAEEPDPQQPAYSDRDLAEALLKEWHRCQRRLQEIALELARLEEHPSAELKRSADKATEDGRDLLEELATELREKIAGKMVQRDVLQAEIEMFKDGKPVFAGEDFADAMYNLALEQVLEEDPMTGFSEWRNRYGDRFNVDDDVDEHVWDGLRKERDRNRKQD